MKPPGTLASAAALLLLVGPWLVGCTGPTGTSPGTAPSAEDPRPLAAEAAEEVLSGLGAGDEVALASIAEPRRVRFLLRRLDNAIRAGEISEVVFTATGEPVIDGAPASVDAGAEGPSPSSSQEASMTARVPYEVEWTSEVGDETLTFAGDLILHRTGDEWVPVLSPSLLFPEHPRAHTWAIERTWLRRGQILDRDGAVLAKGPPDRRSYPQGSVAGSTIGHIGTLTRKDVEEGAAGIRGDTVGASGIEAAFQERLGGRPTSRLLLVDRNGKKIEAAARVRGRRGKDVRTTLDIEVQRAAEAAFGSTTGGSVLIQPQTGDLLAVVSSSSFDPNNFVGATDVAPFNRALSGGYPAGSSMKVMTAAGALDSKTVTATTTVTGPAEYKGVRNFESGKFGSIPFASAVKFSVNTAFAQVAEDMGAKKLTGYAEAFGFNSEPRIPFAATSSFPLPEGLGDLLWASVGQAQTLATPMQMASVAATIANDGKRMEPRIAMHIKPRGKRAVSRSVADVMTRLMEGVVGGGTGVNAQITGVRIAGKTGTAEVDVAGKRKNHAWFVAFAPAGAPEVAVSVVSEYGGIGGEVAAPLARSILQRVLPLLS